MSGGRHSDLSVPDRLAAKASTVPGGAEWLADLPLACQRLSEQWNLDLGAPFPDCHVSLVVPATRHNGASAVLKIPMPLQLRLGTLLGDARGGECRALDRSDGRGAVQLLAHDQERGALLMERCQPGTSLDALPPAAADEVAAGLLRELHEVEVDSQLPRLADRARQTTESLTARWDALGRPFDGDLIDSALAAFRSLTQQEPGEVQLHGDFHHHNILAAECRPWLAIDRLPIRGDGAYDVVPYLLFRKGDLADPGRDWEDVIERVCELARCDTRRVIDWIQLRLVSDAVAALEQRAVVKELDHIHGDLWTARLARSFISP